MMMTPSKELGRGQVQDGYNFGNPSVADINLIHV